MAPTDPLTQQIIERVVTVLAAITAGSDFFYTPADVIKRYVHWREANLSPDNPLYMVFRDSGGTITYIGENNYCADYFINVKGYVQDNNDTVTKMERAIRDVCKAINDDSKGESAGTLGALAAAVTIEEPPETDNGYLSLEGVGFFDQRIRVRIDGEFGEL
jgi:hypothetical protein